MGSPSWTIGVHARQGTEPADLTALLEALESAARQSDRGAESAGIRWFVELRPSAYVLDGFTAMLDVSADSFPVAADVARRIVSMVNAADPQWLLVTDPPEFGDLEDSDAIALDPRNDAALEASAP